MKLWDAGGQVMPNQSISFTAESGGSVNPTTALTNSQGVAQTTFSLGSGNPIVRATYTNACGWQISELIDTTPANSWPMFQHDIAHTGVTQASIPANLTVKWYKDLAGDSGGWNEKLWSSPVVSDGWVYVGTNNPEGTLYAMRVDGTDFTPVNLGSPIHGTPCVADGRVYVGTTDGVLHVRYAQTLQPDWTYQCPPGESITGGVTVWNGAAYVGTEGPNWGFHTIDLTTHQDRISSPATTYYPVSYTTPAIDATFQGGARGYISDLSCAVTAVRCDTGASTWPYPGWHPDESSFYSSPTVHNGYILGGSTGYPTPYAYRIIDGGSTPQQPTVFQFFTGGAVNSTLAALDGKLYFGSLDHYMYCLDASSFQQPADWTANLGSLISSSALLSQPTGMLFTCTEDGIIHGLDITDGSEDGTYPTAADMTTKASLAASNGRLFAVVGNSSGRRLYCFGP